MLFPNLDRIPNVSELIRDQVAADWGRTAVLVAGETADDAHVSLTFGDLDYAARRIASWLQERYSPGTRVLLLYPTGVEFAAAFFGCLYAGMTAVPAPLPGRYQNQQRRLAGIARDADISAVLTESAELVAVAHWATASGLVGLSLLATDRDDVASPDDWTDPGTRREDLALLQYTSGSTSSPKGVMVSHGNLLHNVGALMKGFGTTEPIRFGGWIPMFHDMGLIGVLLPGLLLGGGCVLISPTTFIKRPFRWLQVIDEYDVASSSAPNFGYERCARQLTDAQVADLDLSRWEFACCGSEPVRSSSLRGFAERLAPAGFRATSYFPGYGLAEATLFVAGTAKRVPITQRVNASRLEENAFEPVPPGSRGREVVSMGVPHGAEIRVVDPDSRRVLPPGTVGEIWVRGDSVSQGYWGKPGTTAATFQAAALTEDGQENGFLRTGDLGVVFAGELYVTGRIKDVMIVNGRNIYPQDIEHEIGIQHDELTTLASAVFAVDVVGSEQIVVVQESRGKDKEQLRETATAIRATVAREFGVQVASVMLMRPNTVLRTTSGKVRRAAMRESYLTGELKPICQSNMAVV